MRGPLHLSPPIGCEVECEAAVQGCALCRRCSPPSSHGTFVIWAEDFVDQAQHAVALIWDMVTKAREWIAKVSDVLNPGSDPRKVNGDSAARIADLQKLMVEANGLNVSVAEADEVARIIQAALAWQGKVDELLSTLHAPIRTRAGRSNCIQLSTLCTVLEEAELIPVYLDQRLQLQERVQSESLRFTLLLDISVSR